MAARATELLAGIGWLKNAINLGRDNPKAIFGGAALIVLTLLAVMVPAMVLQTYLLVSFGLEGGAAIAVSMIATLLMLVFSPPLTIGFLRLLDAVEHQRPARPSDVFSAFSKGAGAPRAIAFALLLMVLQTGLLLALLGVFAPETIDWYLQALQMSNAEVATSQAGAPTPVQSSWAAFALLTVVVLFFYAVQALGLGQIALNGRGVTGALSDGVSGAARNAVPLLLFVVVSVLAGIVLGLLLALVAVLLTFIVKLAGTWLLVTLLVLAVPLYLGLMLGAYVVVSGVMYYLWRDVCGPGRSDEPGEVAALTA